MGVCDEFETGVLDSELSSSSSAAVFFHCACAIACLIKRVAAALSISVRSGLKMRIRSFLVFFFFFAYWLVDSLQDLSFQSILEFCSISLQKKEGKSNHGRNHPLRTNSGTTGCVFGSIPRVFK